MNSAYPNAPNTEGLQCDHQAAKRPLKESQKNFAASWESWQVHCSSLLLVVDQKTSHPTKDNFIHIQTTTFMFDMLRAVHLGQQLGIAQHDFCCVQNCFPVECCFSAIFPTDLFAKASVIQAKCKIEGSCQFGCPLHADFSKSETQIVTHCWGCPNFGTPHHWTKPSQTEDDAGELIAFCRGTPPTSRPQWLFTRIPTKCASRCLVSKRS